MARALHDYTALLPLVEIDCVPPAVGTDTRAAMRAGIYWYLVGGTRMLLEQQQPAGPPALVFCTGGDAAWLTPELTRLGWSVRHEPTLTLDGILHTAQAHPDRGETS
jgi:type III pantothenate kinase